MSISWKFSSACSIQKCARSPKCSKSRHCAPPSLSYGPSARTPQPRDRETRLHLLRVRAQLLQLVRVLLAHVLRHRLDGLPVAEPRELAVREDRGRGPEVDIPAAERRHLALEQMPLRQARARCGV